MTIDVKTPDSPGWWLRRCQDKLDERSKRITPLYERYEGNAPLPRSMTTAPDAAQVFFKTARTGLAEMIVKAVRYRVKVVGFKSGVDDDGATDRAVWAAWKRAGMPDEAPDCIRNMLVAGDGFVIAAPDAEGVAATAEDPRQVVTIHDPVRQSRIRAAAKFFHDADLGIDYAYLYRPAEGRRWVARNERSVTRSGRARRVTRFGPAWEWVADKGGAEGESMAQGSLIQRLRNDEGVGEFERHTDLLDRIDHVVLQALVIVTLQAFKQRAIKINDTDMPDRDPDTGEVIDYDDIFTADPAALWKLPESAEMWESGAVDVTPVLGMATKELERLSAVTFTPLSAFTPEGANQSAQGASLVREGMTFKVEDKQERVASAFERVAFAICTLDPEAPDLSRVEALEAVFAPAERHGLAERAAASKDAKVSGVPWESIMTDIWGFTPDKVEAMRSQREDDLLTAGIGDLPAPTAGD